MRDLPRAQTVFENHLPLGQATGFEIVVEREALLESRIEDAVERWTRAVGPVRVQVMHPEEERTAGGPPLQPVNGRRADRPRGVAVPAGRRIVVLLESLLEPLPGAEEQVRDDGGGVVPLVLEDLGQCQVGGGGRREQTA